MDEKLHPELKHGTCYVELETGNRLRDIVVMMVDDRDSSILYAGAMLSWFEELHFGCVRCRFLHFR